ncbi:MAG: ABC transporter permease [Candidatus Izemoplasmataceae bacterium]
MFDYPEQYVYEISGVIDIIIGWILDTFGGVFDVISMVILNLFFMFDFLLGMIPWWGYLLIVFLLGFKLYNVFVGLTLSMLLLAIAMFGLWDPMIYTLVIIFISVLTSLLIGTPIGILMAKSQLTEKILKPLLDGMQTMPSFVYLIPAVMLFGLGRVPAVFATTIYALPPLIRLTYLGIVNVNKEVVEAGKSFGSTPAQMLFKIEIPQALSTIMTGINQTTMMAMAMVVIASMIGAEGIGDEVLIAIRRLEVGRGFQAGIAIVFLAIILDRILQGAAAKFNKVEGLDE